VIQSKNNLKANKGRIIVFVYHMYFVSHLVFSFFKLERCNFTGNRGIGSINDFGSAYAVWLVENLAERASLPHYEITDW